MNLNPRRFASLDGFRALSVSLVMISHLRSPLVFGVTQHLWRWNYGATGVRVFFVISGFLITSLLLGEQALSGRISLRAFYARRIMRIMPAYYVFLLVVALLIPYGLVQAHYRDLLAPALFLSNYQVVDLAVRHTWSLSVEEQFYLLWPCTLIVFGVRRAAVGALALLFVAPVLRILDHSPGWDNQAFAFETMADAIATGCLLAILREKLWANEWYRRVLSWRYFLLIPASIGVVAMQPPEAPVWNACIVSLLNIGIALTLDRYMRYPSGFFGRFLNAAPVVWVGTLSYSLYLWQELFLVNDQHQWPFPVNLAAAFGAATLSFYLVEKPFLRLKRRFAKTA